MSDTAARLRGCGVGAVSTTLAVAAHASGAGMLPGTAALLLLVGLGAALGSAAASLPWPGTSRLGLVVLLAGGQLAGHLLLEVTTMTAHAVPSPLMVAAHSGAVVVAAVLVGLAQRVGTACGAALARVLPVLPSPLVVRPPSAAAPVPVMTPTVRQLLVATSLARRGPPVGA